MDWTTILQRRTSDPRFESVVAWVERGNPADLEAVLATPAPLLPSSCVERLVGLSWRDAGRLYWWIRRQDLAARRFDRVWVGLQCH